MPPFSGSATALHHAVGTWTLAGPTTAGFSVGNLGRRVGGTIPVTSAQVDVAEDGSVAGVSAVLNIDAIATGHARRDKDLRKPSLLDLANHPRLTFSGAEVTPYEGGWRITGLLTAKGTTRGITSPRPHRSRTTAPCGSGQPVSWIAGTTASRRHGS